MNILILSPETYYFFLVHNPRLLIDLLLNVAPQGQETHRRIWACQN